MKIDFWETIISKKIISVDQLNQDESGKLEIRISDNENIKYQLKCRPEVFESGSEEHYLNIWSELNLQLDKINRTTLQIRDSKILENLTFSPTEKPMMCHYVLNGIGKSIHIISGEEPEIELITQPNSEL